MECQEHMCYATLRNDRIKLSRKWPPACVRAHAPEHMVQSIGSLFIISFYKIGVWMHNKIDGIM